MGVVKNRRKGEARENESGERQLRGGRLKRLYMGGLVKAALGERIYKDGFMRTARCKLFLRFIE